MPWSMMAPQVALNNTKQPEIFPAVVFLLLSMFLSLPLHPILPLLSFFLVATYTISVENKQTHTQFLGEYIRYSSGSEHKESDWFVFTLLTTFKWFKIIYKPQSEQLRKASKYNFSNLSTVCTLYREIKKCIFGSAC